MLRFRAILIAAVLAAASVPFFAGAQTSGAEASAASAPRSTEKVTAVPFCSDIVTTNP